MSITLSYSKNSPLKEKRFCVQTPSITLRHFYEACSTALHGHAEKIEIVGMVPGASPEDQSALGDLVHHRKLLGQVNGMVIGWLNHGSGDLNTRSTSCYGSGQHHRRGKKCFGASMAFG